MGSLRGQHAIHKMCAWLSVSQSGYYMWRKRKPIEQTLRPEQVRQAVILVFEQFKKRYGEPRIRVELNEKGIPCSINHVAKLMAESGLKARNDKHFKFYPSGNAINHVSDNLLGRNFSASAPNEKWVSNITYIKLERGFVYLAVIMDLFFTSDHCWALDTSITTELIIEAFEMAKACRNVKPRLILHSDRGVQYCSSENQGQLYEQGIRPSMSRKGNCWDNAAVESFFARMKAESIYAEKFLNKDDAYACVFESIELFYNSVRRHSAIDYKSPRQFEEDYYAQCA
ncbi:MAG: IS3 family transposase [Candidatus Thiodiazotropha endolucinida]